MAWYESIVQMPVAVQLFVFVLGIVVGYLLGYRNGYFKAGE